ncbi:unnamed protein product [Orchesella dallaii]|uniref:Uncharacterized protein n=1 Tax=Orchesella dallaii TaxID=48710 RepID=A0ABP1S1Y2_9HEXA
MGVCYVADCPSRKSKTGCKFVIPKGASEEIRQAWYEGRWYEVEKYWFVFEATSSCVSVEYLDKGDGTFAVEISQIEGLSGRKMKNPGLTRYLSRDGSADFVLDLLVTQSPVPFRFSYPYIVIDTDYISYTVKYRCMQTGPFNLRKENLCLANIFLLLLFMKQNYKIDDFHILLYSICIHFCFQKLCGFYPGTLLYH